VCKSLKLAASTLIIAAGAVFAQSSGGRPAPQFAPRETSVFELSSVVSIKPSKGKDPEGFWMSPGRFLARNVTARLLIAIAYGVQNFEVSGGPSWVDADHFDVEARLEDSRANKGDESAIVKWLLTDRFKLVLHRETRQTSIYALFVARDGPKIRPSADQTLGASPTGGVNIGPGSLVGTGIRLGLVASLLGTRLGRTVVDQTNLPGRYDVTLRWTPDVGEVPAGQGDTPQPDSYGPSLFTAVQQQLGLKLKSIRGRSSFLVIDQMEKPSAN
jgi:bla regulator protein BlaR1